MKQDGKPIRVLYSFPHKLGAQRICYAAWQHVYGLALAGAEVTVFPGVLHKPLPPTVAVTVRPTLARGNLRLPYKLLGRTGALSLHDWIVARRLEKMAGQFDIVHTFPLGALQTLRTAKKMGIPTVLERCNAHTQYAYDVVQKECAKLGITMPPGHEHDYNAAYLRREEAEYKEADYLLCPSEFVARTFRDKGFPEAKLARFQYGFDEKACYPPPMPRPRQKGLTVLFAAGCAPRKGLHYALEAWLQSPAHHDGKFLIVGDFIPGYAEALGSLMDHPSVSRLGYRKDLADVMRQSDILILPSIEEGSALVTYDARGSGCLLLVSDASGAVCQHMENALVHPAGDVATLARHLTMVHEDRDLLETLQASSLKTAPQLTWTAGGAVILAQYRELLGR